LAWADLGGAGGDGRVGLRDLRLQPLDLHGGVGRVQAQQHVAGLDQRVVLHAHLGDDAGHAGGDRVDAAGDEGVVGLHQMLAAPPRAAQPMPPVSSSAPMTSSGTGGPLLAAGGWARRSPVRSCGILVVIRERLFWGGRGPWRPCLETLQRATTWPSSLIAKGPWRTSGSRSARPLKQARRSGSSACSSRRPAPGQRLAGRQGSPPPGRGRARRSQALLAGRRSAARRRAGIEVDDGQRRGQGSASSACRRRPARRQPSPARRGIWAPASRRRARAASARPAG
jgi:hypothetical protein